MFLFGSSMFFDNADNGIIYDVIKFIESTDRVNGSIYD